MVPVLASTALSTKLTLPTSGGALPGARASQAAAASALGCRCGRRQQGGEFGLGDVEGDADGVELGDVDQRRGGGSRLHQRAGENVDLAGAARDGARSLAVAQLHLAAARPPCRSDQGLGGFEVGGGGVERALGDELLLHQFTGAALLAFGPRPGRGHGPTGRGPCRAWRGRRSSKRNSSRPCAPSARPDQHLAMVEVTWARRSTTLSGVTVPVTSMRTGTSCCSARATPTACGGPAGRSAAGTGRGEAWGSGIGVGCFHHHRPPASRARARRSELGRMENFFWGLRGSEGRLGA